MNKTNAKRVLQQRKTMGHYILSKLRLHVVQFLSLKYTNSPTCIYWLSPLNAVHLVF